MKPATTGAGTAASAPASIVEPRPPPTKRNGILRRRTTRIPRDQATLLDSGNSWVEDILRNSGAFQLVPNHVLTELEHQTQVPSEAFATSSSPHHVPPAPSQAVFHKAVSQPQFASSDPAPQRQLSALVSSAPATQQETNSVNVKETTDDIRPEAQSVVPPQISAPEVPATPPHDGPQSTAQYSPDWPTGDEGAAVDSSPPACIQGDEHYNQRRDQATPPRRTREPSAQLGTSPSDELELEVPGVLGCRLKEHEEGGEQEQQELPQQQVHPLHGEVAPLSQDLRIGGRKELPIPSTSRGGQTGQHLMGLDGTAEMADLPSSRIAPSTSDGLATLPKQIQIQPRRRLMKAPVFPTLEKTRRAAPPTKNQEAELTAENLRRNDTGACLSRPFVEAPNPQKNRQAASRSSSGGHSRRSMAPSDSSSVVDELSIRAGLQHNDGNTERTPVTRDFGTEMQNDSADVATTRPAAKGTIGSLQRTWQLPYDMFKSVYPDYCGDLEDFLRACFCLEDLAKAGSLAGVLLDDVIRGYLDFIGYVQGDISGTPLNLLEWYRRNAGTACFREMVVTEKNVAAILRAYPDKVDSIRQLTHEQTPSDKRENRDARVGATPSRELGHSAPKSSPSADRPAILWNSQEELSLPANPLARLAALLGPGSTQESSWLHGQPSSPQLMCRTDFHEGDTSQSRSQNRSQIGQTHRGLIGSPGLDTSGSSLKLPSSVPPTATLPAGMDKIDYVLRSQELESLPEPELEPQAESPPEERFSSQQQRPSLEPCSQLPNDDISVSVQPTTTDSTSQKRAREESPSMFMPQDYDDEEEEEEEDAWDEEKEEEIFETAPAPPETVIVINDDDDVDDADNEGDVNYEEAEEDEEDEGDAFEPSTISVQSAREARARPPLEQQPIPHNERRRVTIAGSDLREMAGSAKERHPAVGKEAAAAAAAAEMATGEPPKKKRKTKGRRKGVVPPIDMKLFAEFLKKKAEQLGKGKGK